MTARTRKFLIILGSVFCVLWGIKELRGEGLIALTNCSQDFRIPRCVGIDSESPISMIQDFYFYINKKIAHQAT